MSTVAEPIGRPSVPGAERPLRVLYVSHNHPTLHPGGAEAYALELYEAMRERPEVDPVLLARIGSNVAQQSQRRIPARRSARSTTTPTSTSSSQRPSISTSSR